MILLNWMNKKEFRKLAVRNFGLFISDLQYDQLARPLKEKKEVKEKEVKNTLEVKLVKKRSRMKLDQQKACPVCYTDYSIVPKCRYWNQDHIQDVNILLFAHIQLHSSRRQSHSVCFQCCVYWLTEMLLRKDKWELQIMSGQKSIKVSECHKKCVQLNDKKINKCIQPCNKPVDILYIIQQFPSVKCQLLPLDIQTRIASITKYTLEEMGNIDMKFMFLIYIDYVYKLADKTNIPCFDSKCRGFTSVYNEWRKCAKCQLRWCQACQLEMKYHDKTCEEIKDAMYDSKTMEHILNKVKEGEMIRCPNRLCLVWIEKDGGCNHLHCQKCNGHICFKCKCLFQTSEQVYNHLGDRSSACYGIF